MRTPADTLSETFTYPMRDTAGATDIAQLTITLQEPTTRRWQSMTAHSAGRRSSFRPAPGAIRPATCCPTTGTSIPATASRSPAYVPAPSFPAATR
ncbi:MAG: hypothetical protein IPN78_10365 [Candidatus Accumulibacter sp.]|nr:hypothetical protein [Candidatus Accumulibacter propinquus]